jgi:hypothetical protein
MPPPNQAKKARRLNLASAHAAARLSESFFELPPFPVGTFPVEDVSEPPLEDSSECDEPHHGPPRRAFQPLDALEGEDDVEDIDPDGVVVDLEAEAELAEANMVPLEAMQKYVPLLFIPNYFTDFIILFRYADSSVRFMHAYRTGLSGGAAAWVDRRYHDHRTIPPEWIAKVREVYIDTL